MHIYSFGFNSTKNINSKGSNFPEKKWNRNSLVINKNNKFKRSCAYRLFIAFKRVKILRKIMKLEFPGNKHIYTLSLMDLQSFKKFHAAV